MFTLVTGPLKEVAISSNRQLNWMLKLQRFKLNFLVGEIINYMDHLTSGSVCSQLPTFSGLRRVNHASIVPFAEEKVHIYLSTYSRW